MSGIILLAYLTVIAIEYILEYLNLSHLKRHGSVIPPEFEGLIDQGLLDRVKSYTIEKARFGVIASLSGSILTLLFIFGGLLDYYNSWVASLNLPFILSGLVFFLLIVYAQTIVNIPFSLYNNFRIEKRYGFSTMTVRLWIVDFLKSLLISTVLIGIVISAGLWLVSESPGFWWFWVWCFFLVFGTFIMYISPYVIEPLFNKYTPVDDESLVGDIRTLMQKAGIMVSRVFKMDASKRSRHTNAYFTGIGRVKRIVLFDTILEKLDKGEILSVLAHEAGHWRKRHILKMMFLTEGIALILLYISYRILQTDMLTAVFNIREDAFFAEVLLLAFTGSIVLFPFTPLFNYISRRHEREADRFSLELTGDWTGMTGALVKLSKDNLSNLHPHPLYASFHYSHPPVLERIRRIKGYKTK